MAAEREMEGRGRWVEKERRRGWAEIARDEDVKDEGARGDESVDTMKVACETQGLMAIIL